MKSVPRFPGFSGVQLCNGAGPVVNGKLSGWVGIGSKNGERIQKAACSRD
jgi:hypothetical protein